MTNFHIIWTLTMLVIFFLIIFWAFSSKRKAEFETAANIALEPDDSDRIPSTPSAKELQHD